MAWFQWISLRTLPPAWDLRRCGWEQALDIGEARGSPIALLIDGSMPDAAPEDLPLALRPRTLALGLVDSVARARWLELGYGDALPTDLDIFELGQRAARTLASLAASAFRRVGCLRLDLLTRDAQVDGVRLRLHPREFALLWRLAEAAGCQVNRTTLLRDVFELNFDPGTNRLAVHVCRLRKKLALAGLANLLATAPGESAYRLDVSAGTSGRWDEGAAPPQRLPAEPQFLFDPLFLLDQSGRLGEHARSFEELVQ